MEVTEEKDEEIAQEQKEQLYNRVQELKSFNTALLAEIDLFERCISRIDPQDLGHPAGNGPGGSQLEGTGRGRRQKTRSNVPGCLQQLSLEQKLYVAQREVKETQKDQEKLRQRCDRIQDNYKVSLKEAEMRLSEIRKAQKEFEIRLLRPLKGNKLDLKEPEKMLQHIQDKSKITQLEKFHVKNQALKVQEKKLQQQIFQKGEAGKADYEEVFQEFDEQKVEKNLDELQVNNLKVQRALSLNKEKLQKVTQESTQLSNDITNRKQTLAKIEEEIQHVQKEHSKAEALNQHLRRQIEDYEAPSVMDYIHVKQKKKTLQKSIHTLQRKVGIAELAFRTQSKAWNPQRAIITPANSAEAGARPGHHRTLVRLPHIAEHGT